MSCLIYARRKQRESLGTRLHECVCFTCDCFYMYNVYRSVFEAMDEESIVFVFGDHGMTVSGDHGGETELETTAALLVYTPTPLFPPVQVI